MKREKSTTTTTLLGLACALLVAAAPSPRVFAEPTVLNSISPWPTAYYWVEPLMEFQRMVDERLKGKLKIEYLGGKEVVPTFARYTTLPFSRWIFRIVS